jgi:hypothetical protein
MVASQLRYSKEQDSDYFLKKGYFNFGIQTRAVLECSVICSLVLWCRALIVVVDAIAQVQCHIGEQLDCAERKPGPMKDMNTLWRRKVGKVPVNREV